MTGLILMAHGSRREDANEEVRRLARAIETSGAAPRVDPAFLEAASPDLVTAAEVQARAGCRRILVLPLFLNTGNHVRRDIPRLIAQARAACPGVEICQLDHLGADDRQAELIGQIARSAVTAAEGIPAC